MYLENMSLRNVIECVTHPDPYLFYAQLMTENPFYFDHSLNAWVATSSEAVTEVLAHESCVVRPASAPVPAHLLGSTAGMIFGNLMRMNDGNKHEIPRKAVTDQMHFFSAEKVSAASAFWAQQLINDPDGRSLNQFASDLPVYIVAELLGIAHEHIRTCVERFQTFALCMNPLSSPAQVEQGKSAADELMYFFQQEIDSPFYRQLVEKTSPEIAAANCIGLMFQSYEATAGLIGNTLHTLARFPTYVDQIMSNPFLLGKFILEVNCWDPSVQNTRRYLISDAIISGQNMSEGDAVIVVLAAANRDERVNPNPHQFSLKRTNPVSYTFGLGRHACIGEMMAVTIAQAAVEQVLFHDLHLSIDAEATFYRLYGNLRVPILKTNKEAV